MLAQVTERVKKILKIYFSKEGTLFTNSFAFSFTFGMAPLILVIVLLFSKYIVNPDLIAEFLSSYMPQEFVSSFVDYIKLITVDNVLSAIAMFVAANLIASKSIYSLMLFDEQYQTKQTPKIILRIISVLSLVIIIFTAGMLIVFTDIINNMFLRIPDISQWVLLFLVLLVMYRLIFIKTGTFKMVYQGALFCSLGMYLMGKIFFEIVYHYSNYPTIYGPLASIMILLLSNYIIASLVYGGYCINKVAREETMVNVKID